MDLERAQQTTKKYMESIGAPDPSAFLPLSSLPFSKEEIKNAVKTYMAYLMSIGQLSEKVKNALEVGYITLAAFIDDEQYRSILSTQSAMSDTAALGLENLRKQLSGSGKDVFMNQLNELVLVTQRVKEETDFLLSDIRDFYAKASVALKRSKTTTSTEDEEETRSRDAADDPDKPTAVTL